MTTSQVQPQKRVGRAIPAAALARHVNNTPFPSQYFQSVDAHAEVSHVVVLRVTFDMQRTLPDGSLAYAAEQTPLATQDAWSGAVNASSPLWESDFAPYKPRCDVLVVNAVARPPDGRQTAKRWPCAVALQWQQDGKTQLWHKQLTVTGPRRFGLLGLSEPTPASEAAVDWTLAYGGQDKRPAHDEHRPDGSIAKAAGSVHWKTDQRNPVGVGLDRATGSPGPQLELLDRPYKGGPDQRDYLPVGLTAMGRAWQPRRSLAGTYDQAWLEQQWPLPPQDFDDNYWNCAPADQQLDHLPPGTKMSLFHLHPSAAASAPASPPWPEHWQGRLPLHQFTLRLLMRIEGQRYLHDIDMGIDTLVIDLARRRVSACLRYSLQHSALQGQELLEMQTWMAPVGRPYDAIPSEEFGPLGARS